VSVGCGWPGPLSRPAPIAAEITSRANLGPYSLLKSSLPLLPSVQTLFYSFCDFSSDGLMFMDAARADTAFKYWTRRVFFGRKTKRQQALAKQRNVDSSLIPYA